MKKFLFAALAFASLAFVGCSDNKGVVNKDSYSFVSSHLQFDFNLDGELAKFVDVVPTTTLPTSQGLANTSAEGKRHTIFISNIKCPAKFDVVYILKPKKSVVADENTSYDYKTNYSFTVTRNFSDNTHIVGEEFTSSDITGSIKGKDIAKFIEVNSDMVFTFHLTHDGYIDDTESEE